MSAGAKDGSLFQESTPGSGATGMGPIRFNERSSVPAQLQATQPAHQLALIHHLGQSRIDERFVEAFAVLEKVLAGLGFQLHAVVVEPAEMFISSASTAVRRGRAFVNEASAPRAAATPPLFRIGLELTAAVNFLDQGKPLEDMSVFAWSLSDGMLIREPFFADEEGAEAFHRHLGAVLVP